MDATTIGETEEGIATADLHNRFVRRNAPWAAMCIIPIAQLHALQVLLR